MCNATFQDKKHFIKLRQLYNIVGLPDSKLYTETVKDLHSLTLRALNFVRTLCECLIMLSNLHVIVLFVLLL